MEELLELLHIAHTGYEIYTEQKEFRAIQKAYEDFNKPMPQEPIADDYVPPSLIPKLDAQAIPEKDAPGINPNDLPDAHPAINPNDLPDAHPAINPNDLPDANAMVPFDGMY